MMQASSRPRVQ